MNVKKMTTEHLQAWVEEYNSWKSNPVDISNALLDCYKACEKELMRRWGIKQ